MILCYITHKICILLSSLLSIALCCKCLNNFLLSFLVDGGLKFKFVNIGKLQGFFFVCDRRSVKLFLYDKQFHGRKTLQTVIIVFESATLQKFFISHQMIGLTHLGWKRIIYSHYESISHFYAKWYISFH